MYFTNVYKMNFKLFCMLFILTKSGKAINHPKPVSGFFYTMPQSLLSGKNETVCFSIHSSLISPVKINLDLKLGQKNFVTSRTIDSEHSCFELRVPSYNKIQPQSVNIKVQVLMNGVTYTAYNQDPVRIYPKKKYIFVNTDRNVYKSEDLVRLRVLSLKDGLLPETNILSYVRIINPLGVSAVVWKNVSTDLGLVHLQHQLSRDAILGKWKIEADGETKKIFEVNKYALPRFKVLVTYPKTIYYKTILVTIKVCARYSYGAIVKGAAFLRLSDSLNGIKRAQALKKMLDGCAEFNFTQTELSLDRIRKNNVNERVTFLITATVTEEGTDNIELTNGKIVVMFQPYNVKFARHDSFMPGLPYHGIIFLNNVNIDLNGEVVEICYNIAINKSWNYLDNEQCSNFTVDNKKTIHFYILPLQSNVIHFQLNARSVKHLEVVDTLLVVRIYSPSSSYIDLEEIHLEEKPHCKSAQQFSVQYTTNCLKEGENVTFFYMIKYRNQIYKMRKIIHTVEKHLPNYTNEYKDTLGTIHRQTKLDSSIDKFILKFRIDNKITSNFQLLVYYGTNKGEIVSAVKEVKIGICLPNEIKANWSHKQIVPGGTASLLLETKSDSLCSVSTVDKATTFINGINAVTPRSILALFLEEQESLHSRRKPCVSPTKRNRNFLVALQKYKTLDSGRKKRYIYSFSEDYDAFDIFNKIGIVTITNFKIVTKPCYIGPPPSTNNPVEFLTDQYDIQTEDTKTPVRSFFPETWLWELIPVRNAAVIHRNIPHSITTWVTNILCVSATDGLGISYPSEITSFQPFFMQVLTPYSVKKKETVYLHVIVFNYLTYNIPIRISLDISIGLSLLDPFQKKNVSYCISSNNTVTHVFELSAVKVEKVNLTVVAELDSMYPGECGPDILINKRRQNVQLFAWAEITDDYGLNLCNSIPKRDVVFRTFLVEHEGYPIQNTKSALLCGADFHQTLNNITWTLKIPKNIVPDTLKTEILFSGDIIGQAIKNFDNLIVMPTGCGEQVMATLASNLSILKYLNATKSLTNAVKHKIFRNLKIGYHRILNYVHKDGSFSAFGYHDSSGSMFLTAFVVQTLQTVKQYIYVDQRVLDRAVAWILRHQLENGCFDTMLHVFQDMGETSFENSTASLTAYVIISLFNGNVQIPESVQTNAKYCIRGYNHLHKYTLAISAYALLKINWFSEANRILKKLLEISNQKDNMIWWSNRETNESTARDIEITSYVLLSLLHLRSQENLAKAHSIVRWLSAQQGAHGGFQSSQDTVVALDALTRYSHLVNYDLTNLHVTLNTDKKYKFTLNKEDRLKSKKIFLKKHDTEVNIQVQGKGCILAQTVQSYYIEYVTTSDAFKLDSEVLPLSKLDECSIVTISSCLSYTGPDLLSNMAILEIDLPSGYEADRVSLYKLIDEDKTNKVKMFEETQQKIVLYMTKLTSHPVCINFIITENVIVHSRSNYTIKLYDYYKPEYHIVQLYRMNKTCKFANLTVMPSVK